MTLVSVLPLSGQVLTFSTPLLDASNTEIHNDLLRPEENMGGPVLTGTIHVRELERPLQGKGLRDLLKAQELIAKGEATRAMERLRAAMKDPGAEGQALAILATEHLRRGDLDVAIMEFQRAVELLPGRAAVHSNLALALGMTGQNEAGLKEARKALQLDQGRPKTRFVLGQILLQMGRKEEAEFHLKKAAVELAGARALLEQYFGGSQALPTRAAP